MARPRPSVPGDRSAIDPVAQPAAPPSATDGSLLRRLAAGQDTAADALYRRYAARIRSLASARLPEHLIARADPDDVVQSVFRAFFASAKQGLYRVPDGETLWGLLAVVTVNKVRSLYEHHAADRRDAKRTVPWGRTDVPILESDLMEVAVRDVLDHLPPMERAAVELRLEGFEVAEIAGQCGRSKRAVERSLQKARKHLTELVGPVPS
jgi:RNA polymerase sigma factor (sigma-70 family)